MDAYQNVGIKRRLGRFFRRDGRALIFAMDHGFEHGPTDFEEHWEHVNPRVIIKKVMRAGVDGVMMLPGIARIAGNDVRPDRGLMIKLTSKTNLRPKDAQLLQSQLGFVEDAIKLGADAIAATVYWGSPPQEDVMMRQFAEIASYAHDLGFPPVVQFAYPRGPPTSTRSTEARRTTASSCTGRGRPPRAERT